MMLGVNGRPGKERRSGREGGGGGIEGRKEREGR